MRKILLFILIIINVTSYAQFTRREKVDCFQNAIDAFNNNNLILADSLFSESINMCPTKEAVFNKALINLILNDSCEACYYFSLSGWMFDDKEAVKIYNKLCIHDIDTNYYNRDFELQENSKKYKYLEEIRTFKCSPYLEGIVHKKNYHGTSIITAPSDIFSNPRSVDIFASYELIDSIKYFDFIGSAKFYENNDKQIKNINELLKVILNEKYDFSKIEQSDKFYYVNIVVDSRGNVSDCEIADHPFDECEEGIQEKIIEDIYSVIKNMKGLTPDSFMGTPVISRRTMSLSL